MNELKKYIEKHPGLSKKWIAEQLGISRPTLNAWIKRPTEQFTGEEIKKIRALK